MTRAWRRCATCPICSRSAWSMTWPGDPTRRSSSATRPAVSGISPASPAATRKCGGTFASPTARPCWANSMPTCRNSAICANCSSLARAANSKLFSQRRGKPGTPGPPKPRMAEPQVAPSQEFLDLPPLLGAQGAVRLPGSKSISNRTLLLAALAEGETDIRDLLASDDVERMLDALTALGIAWSREEGTDHYRVTGAGGPFPVKSGDLFLGNAGTAFRPLTAALAFSGGSYRLSGVPRMHERPIGDLVDGLRQLGARVDYLGQEGYPPLQIHPATITPSGVVQVRGDVSSQFLTALLMALPLAGVETTVTVVGELISKPYIGITLDRMARFGVAVVREGWSRFTVPGGARYRSPGTLFVEGDASSASYFLAAGAIGGGPVRVEGVGRASIQGDVRFAEALAQLGARVDMGDNWIEASAGARCGPGCLPGWSAPAGAARRATPGPARTGRDRKSTRLNSSHHSISYAVFC